MRAEMRDQANARRQHLRLEDVGHRDIDEERPTFAKRFEPAVYT